VINSYFLKAEGGAALFVLFGALSQVIGEDISQR